MDIERFAFRLEFFNELAALNDIYQLLYYVRRDGKDEIEIMDTKHKRRFLSRVHYPALKLEHIHLGGKITIYSRQYRVVDFEDDFTRSRLGKSKQKCFAIITSRGISNNSVGKIWNAVETSGLRVTNAKMVTLDAGDASSVATGCDTPVTAGSVIALELHGEDCHAAWARLRDHLADNGSITASDAAVAHAEHDERLRNAFFGARADRLTSSLNNVGRLEECTSVLILPSAVAKLQTGAILGDLLGQVGEVAAPLRVSALGMYDLDRRTAEEYLEVYKHVIPDFVDYAGELCSGALIALELSGYDAVNRVRKIVGPRDVDVAKRIRPDTLRAIYGESTCKPSIHCTDLPEDGPLDSEYIFSLIAQP